MITENVSTLKIHKLKTQQQYDKLKETNALDDYALYLTPEAEEKVVYKNFLSSSDELILDDIQNTGINPIIAKMPLNLFHTEAGPLVSKPPLGGGSIGTYYGVTFASDYGEGLIINGTSTNTAHANVSLFTYYIGMNVHETYCQNAKVVFEDDKMDKTFTIDLRGLQDLKCSSADGSQFTPIIQVLIENAHKATPKWFQYAHEFDYFTTIDFNNLENGDYLSIKMELEPSVTFNNSIGYINILRGSYAESDLKPYVAGSRSGHYSYGGAGTLTVYKGNKTEPYTTYEYLGGAMYGNISIPLPSPTARIVSSGNDIVLGIKYNIKKPEPNCITGEGWPSQTLVGSVGSLYMDTTNGHLYQCRGEEDVGIYNWEKVAPNKMDKFGTVSDSKITTSSSSFELKNSSSNATLKYTSGTSQLKGSSSVILKAPSINLQPYNSTSGQININNVKTPTSSYQAANKSYVDSAKTSLQNSINTAKTTIMSNFNSKSTIQSSDFGASLNSQVVYPIAHDLDINVSNYKPKETTLKSTFAATNSNSTTGTSSSTFPLVESFNISSGIKLRGKIKISIPSQPQCTNTTLHFFNSGYYGPADPNVAVNTESAVSFETGPVNGNDTIVQLAISPTNLNDYSAEITISDLEITAVEFVPCSPKDVSVSVIGKNLLPNNYADSSSLTTTSNVKFSTNRDGSITADVSTISSSCYYWFIPQNSLLLQPGTYYFSAGVKGSSATYYVCLKYGDQEVYSYNTSSFTITEPTLCGCCFCIFPVVTNLGSITIYPQLEIGSLTDYEPFNIQTAKADVSGKVTGLISVSPKMTIQSDSNYAKLSCSYYRKIIEDFVDEPIENALDNIKDDLNRTSIKRSLNNTLALTNVSPIPHKIKLKLNNYAEVPIYPYDASFPNTVIQADAADSSITYENVSVVMKKDHTLTVSGTVPAMASTTGDGQSLILKTLSLPAGRYYISAIRDIPPEIEISAVRLGIATDNGETTNYYEVIDNYPTLLTLQKETEIEISLVIGGNYTEYPIYINNYSITPVIKQVNTNVTDRDVEVYGKNLWQDNYALTIDGSTSNSEELALTYFNYDFGYEPMVLSYNIKTSDIPADLSGELITALIEYTDGHNETVSLYDANDSDGFYQIQIASNKHIGVVSISLTKEDNFTTGQINLFDIQLELGTEATNFEAPYSYKNYNTNSLGEVEFNSIGPNMTIVADRPDVSLSCEYLKDIQGSTDSAIKTFVENRILYGSLELDDLPEDVSVGTIYIQIDESN